MTAVSLSFSLRERFTNVVDTGSAGTMSDPPRMCAVGSASMYVETEAAVAPADSDVRLNLPSVVAPAEAFAQDGHTAVPELLQGMDDDRESERGTAARFLSSAAAVVVTYSVL